MPDKLRILLLGDYSNCHNTLATGLRRLGCDVTVVSDGSKHLDTERNLDITRRPGKLGGMELLWRLNHGQLRKALSGNDIVAINDPNFAKLHPRRLRPLFDRLCRENGSVFLTAMGTNVAFLDMLEAPDSPIHYSEWMVDHKPARLMEAHPEQWQQWHTPELTDYQRYVFSRLSGAVSVLYEYQLAMERAMGTQRTAYGGIPIDTQAFAPVELPDRVARLRFFLARDPARKLIKGSDLLEVAAKRVVGKYPDKAELVIVENRPYKEFVELLRSAHVVLDQIYSYTPATTALMAMAYGLNVVSGAEPDFYDFIGETDNRPIINAPLTLDALTDTLERILLNPGEIAPRGRASRSFAEKHNDVDVVASRFLSFWRSRLGK